MENILLTNKEFDDLLEYSTSVPTGTKIGKKWKRHIFVFENKHGIKFNAGYLPSDVKYVEDYWLMGEYVKSNLKDHVDIVWKKIVIVGNLEIDKKIYQFGLRN